MRIRIFLCLMSVMLLSCMAMAEEKVSPIDSCYEAAKQYESVSDLYNAALCYSEGIKIARYGYDFRNEEYLYTILIELMRSPDYLKILTDSSLDYFRSREKLTKDDD